MMFLATEVSLTVWYFPGLLFLSFQKHGCDVSLYLLSMDFTSLP